MSQAIAKCCLAVLFCLVAAAVATSADSSVMLFNLKPDVPDHVSVSKDGVACTFHYAANGGSSEEWRMELSHRTEYEFECVVGRPTPPSYLYFTSFSLSMSGADEFVEAAAYENSSRLPHSAVAVDEDDMTLQNSSDWSGTISLVQMLVEA